MVGRFNRWPTGRWNTERGKTEAKSGRNNRTGRFGNGPAKDLIVDVEQCFVGVSKTYGRTI